MAQEISQGSLFGRIGSGIGKGLASQLPEEINRGRLASGLKNFETEHQNLNPMQQLARLSGIPGITPQMIQSFSELAKMNNQRNAYARGQGGPGMGEVNVANSLDQAENAGMPMQQQFNPAANPIPQGGANAQAAGFLPNGKTQQIENEPPLSDRTLTKPPWTPQQRDAKVTQYMNQGFLVDQAKDLASDDEQRDLASPAAYQKRLDELTAKSDQARGEFKRQLETKLQKAGEGVFKDVTGEMLVNMERGLERDLRTHPEASFKDVANAWSNKALDVAKAKGQVDKLAQTSGYEAFFKGDQILNKLKSYEKIFKDSGNAEEYSNILKKSPSEGGFGLSPQGAASVAFPLSKSVKSFIDGFKVDMSNKNAIKAAIGIEKFIDSDDSLLSIARALSLKNPDFKQEDFFAQLNQDQDNLRLNARQRRELAEGQRDILPSWGDLKYLPWGLKK